MEKKAHRNPSNEKHKDWMSGMPDEILIMILSRLTMKEAVRTSVLSRKWKKLWKFFTGIMEFDAVETMVLVDGGRKDAKLEACKFRDRVNRVLNSHQGAFVEGLRVAYDMGVYFTEDINRWIDFAMVKKVQSLELTLSHHMSCHKDSELMYIFPAWTLLESPLQHSSFHTLTSLRLKSVNVTEEVITYFLSNCPLLEQLCVHDAPTISHLKIAGPKLKLKELEITNCKNLKDLKISAAELVVFNYDGPKIDMPLEDVPLLSSVFLGGAYCKHLIPRFNKLSFYISQLQQLVLDLNGTVRDKSWRFPERFPEFSSLKQLELKFQVYEDQCILFLSSFLYASPRLHKFVLKYTIDWGWLKMWPPNEELLRIEKKYKRSFKKCPHEHLKVVEFCGWIGLDTDFDLAMHLLEVASSLGTVIIDTRDPYFVKRRLDLIMTQCPQKMKVARERAQELATKLPHGVDLVML